MSIRLLSCISLLLGAAVLGLGCSRADAPAVEGDIEAESASAATARANGANGANEANEANAANEATPTSHLDDAVAEAGGGHCAGGGDCAGNCGQVAVPMAAPAPTPAAPGTPAQTFGDDLDAARSVTPLATLIDRPSDFDGQVVKTEGVIAAVCQRMGCWMELRADDGGPSIRVPMAGHSFFLPRDVAGRRATVEGTVSVRELDPGTQEHLRAEGAQAAGQALAISATGVIVHGA